MPQFEITIDSSCDGNLNELHALGINVICYNYTDGKFEYLDNMDEVNNKKVFDNMRFNDTKYSTSQLNQYHYINFFRDNLGPYKKLIHISLTEGLSSSINQARLAANALKEEDPEVEIEIIDSLIACNGELVLLDQLLKLRDEGLNIIEAATKIKEIAKSVNTYYTTDTLAYFVRGGRLPRVAGIVGSVLRINPILVCNKVGNLKVDKQVRGRKNAFKYIMEQVGETVINPEEQDIYICHADNLEGANEYKNELLNRFHFRNAKIYQMGPIIGAHCGPGLIAIFYLGKERSKK